jgi:tRNA(Ile)-lysidine synthase TilS/MesJ
MPYARENMKNMLAQMEEQFPNIFVTVNAAFKNISDETFFDKERFII